MATPVIVWTSYSYLHTSIFDKAQETRNILKRAKRTLDDILSGL